MIDAGAESPAEAPRPPAPETLRLYAALPRLIGPLTAAFAAMTRVSGRNPSGPRR